MTAITYTIARENLASTMDKVCQDHNPVIITRGRKDAVVMMSLEDYSAWEETAYLMRSPANALRLLESIEEMKQGNGVRKTLSDLMGE
jgi:antitoxin YefM